MFSHRTHRTHGNVLCENPSRRKPFCDIRDICGRQKNIILWELENIYPWEAKNICPWEFDISHRTHRTHGNVLCENPSRRKPSVISVLSVGD